MDKQQFKDEWDRINYENLTLEENKIIRKARRNGFDYFYPSYPTWQDQGLKTLEGAKKFLAGLVCFK